MYQKTMLIGRLGKDPELSYAQSGTAICKFSVAVSEKYKDVESTEWFNVVCFNKLAEICGQYLSKGSKVFLEGRMKTSSWDADGGKKYKTELIGNAMVMLDDKKQSGQTPPENQPGYSESLGDDIPF